VWPTTINRQSLSGSTGAMETHPACIMYRYFLLYGSGSLDLFFRHFVVKCTVLYTVTAKI
jgi:hypothetical protein